MKKDLSMIVVLALVGVAFGITSCSSSGEADAIVIERTSYEVPEEGGSVTLTVNSNVPYEVSSSESWIRTNSSKTRALESSGVILTIDKNTSGDERYGTVKISNRTSGIEKFINIHQKFALNFIIDNTSFVFDEHGGEGEFSYASNTTIEIESEDWIVMKEKSTEYDKVVQKFEVKAFAERQQSREGKIKFKTPKSDVNESITIKQSAPLFISEDSPLEMYITEEKQLPLKNETGGAVFWASSDKSIVEVKDGVIKILKEGKTTISVSSSDGTHKDIIEVNAFEITSKFSVTFEDILDGTGNYRTVYTNCLFYNGSKRAINVTSLKVYSGEIPPEDSPLKPWVTEADKSLLGEVIPGETKGIYYSVNVIGSGGHDDDLTFEWTVEFNGNEYICRYPHHVHETW